MHETALADGISVLVEVGSVEHERENGAHSPVAPSLPRPRRKPLVYANVAATKQARRLLPGRVLELEVERAIMANRVGMGGVEVYLERGLVALCTRVPGRHRPRPRAWYVARLERR